jgi:hypothetical protein
MKVKKEVNALTYIGVNEGIKEEMRRDKPKNTPPIPISLRPPTWVVSRLIGRGSIILLNNQH